MIGRYIHQSYPGINPPIKKKNRILFHETKKMFMIYHLIDLFI